MQRKRLLVQQLLLIMEGSAGSEGRLAVSCALSLRTGAHHQVVAVLSGLDGAAVVLRLGGTAYFIGYAVAEPEAEPEQVSSTSLTYQSLACISL